MTDIKTLTPDVNAVIINEGGEVRSMVGTDAVSAFRLRMIRDGLKFEANGMRLTRGVSCLKLAKQMTGLRTNNRDLLWARMNELLNAQLDKCVVITDGE